MGDAWLGQLTFAPGEGTVQYGASFPGDAPHGYANPGNGPARFILTVYEPHVGARS